jgi:ACS family glucarate transporter-like MFS transporter
MWGVALVQSAAVYTQYLFLTWLPGYLEQAHGLSVLKSGTFTAIPYVVAMVFGIGLGMVFDRMLDAGAIASGRRRLMVAGCLLVSSVVLLTPFVSSVAVIIVLISVSMTCIATAVSMNLALLGDLLRSRNLAGRATSIAMIGGNTFGLAAPIVTGYVVQMTKSYTAAFVVAGIFLLAGTTVALTMTRKPIGAEVVAPTPAVQLT